jgi:hypothetical protein
LLVIGSLSVAGFNAAQSLYEKVRSEGTECSPLAANQFTIPLHWIEAAMAGRRRLASKSLEETNASIAQQ